MTNKKTVVLGVTGSIAAHKAVDLCGLLTKAGVDVHVVMTEAAQEFISPLPFKTLSKNPVIASLYDEEEDWCPTHIQLANRADLLLIAPATANTIAKLAVGLSGDALGCIALALNPGARLIIAPALNDKMWQHPATQANVATLTKRGARIVGPFEGELACGSEGLGRLAPIEDIAATALQAVGLAL
jgi:phosphopantothenoylcysteine synthetase/decarboxylase